jgi:homoserine kinase type II
MAVYTDVAAEDLGAFLAGYDLGELLAYKGIAEGVENSNFLVHTSRGYFILTLYEKRVAAADLPFFLALMEHLAVADDLPAAGQEPARRGAWSLAGRPAAIVTFLDGMWIRRPSAAIAPRSAGALAQLHLAGRDFRGQARQCAVRRRLAAAL